MNNVFDMPVEWKRNAAEKALKKILKYEVLPAKEQEKIEQEISIYEGNEVNYDKFYDFCKIKLGEKKFKKFQELSAEFLKERQKINENQIKKDFLTFFQNDAKFADTLNPPLKIDNYLDNAHMFYLQQPFFFDNQEMWWIWKTDHWEMTDEVEMGRMLDKGLGFVGQTITASIRNNHLTALKWVGREKCPKEAPKKWIQFKTKAYSLESKNIYDVTPDYFFTNPIPFEIGESAETPIMDKLITEWMGEDYKKTAYEIIAYCCLNNYPIHLIFCLVGCGRNGKSKFLGLINKFIGKENMCSTELDSLLNSRFESAKLYKKLVCVLGETNFEIISKTSLLKKLTGQDLVGFEFKNKKPFDDYNYAKIIIASNSLPTTADTSEGFYRRWLIIDFQNIFEEGKDILSIIPEQEYNNLAKKVIEILPDLVNVGKFTNQGNIQERKTKYIISSNPLSIFIEKCCDVNENNFISQAELYTSYIYFLNENKKRRVKLKEFKSAMEDEGFWADRTSRKIGLDNTGYPQYKSTYWIDGISLKNNWKGECKLCNYAGFLYQPHMLFSPIEKNCINTQFTQGKNKEKTIKTQDLMVEEEQVLDENEQKEVIHHKCSVCGKTPCASFTAQGKPICSECIKYQQNGESG